MPKTKNKFFRYLTTCSMFCALLAVPSPFKAQAAESVQACGGNSTVDVLGAKTAQGYRAFLAELQGAVQAGNKEKIAGMIGYPLLVLRSGKRSRIRSKQAFLANYDEIFAAPVRDAIARQSAQCLFGNAQGAMVGKGEVWFTEQSGGAIKIITVNESSASL